MLTMNASKALRDDGSASQMARLESCVFTGGAFTVVLISDGYLECRAIHNYYFASLRLNGSLPEHHCEMCVKFQDSGGSTRTEDGKKVGTTFYLLTLYHIGFAS